MNKLRSLLLLFVSLLISAGVSSPLLAAENSSRPALPDVIGPIPVSNTSRPFLDASKILETVGYVEDEYFLSGEANVYDWAGNDTAVKVVAGPTRYVTRILVRRPKNPEDFSGNVEVKILNATRGYDYGTFTDFERMTREGDAWVGITSKPINVVALQFFDRERYKTLDWSTPVPESKRCSYPSLYPVYMTGEGAIMRFLIRIGIVPHTSMPETEDGLLWDMLAQLGLLLKSDEGQKLLPGFGEPKLFMTGISQSSIAIWTWMAGFHNLYRLPDGKPIYDGYLAIVGPALARIHQCSDDVLLDDPRQKLTPPDVPFIALYSEGEMWLAKHTHQPDTFTENGGIVTYEVAGGAHGRKEIPGAARKIVGAPTSEDIIRAAKKAPDSSFLEKVVRMGAEPTDFVWSPIMRGAFHNLKRWANEGVRPPQAPFIELNADGEVIRDQHGNALGGVRMPYIDVPVATYQGNLSDGGLGAILGTRQALADETLISLYPDRSAYLERFSDATDRKVEQRWILPEDAEAMKKAASKTMLPN